jgi:hypothetical protein
MRRSISLVALAAVLVLGATACGGDDASSSSDTTAVSSAATGGDSGSTATGDFCEASREQLARATTGGQQELLGTVLPGLLDPSKAEASRAQLRKLTNDLREGNEAVVAAAPTEIRDDLDTLLSAFTALYDALEDADYDVTKVDIEALSGVPDDPKLEAAAGRVGTYYKDRCGIDLDTLVE